MKKAIEWFIHDRSDTAMICRTVFEAFAAYITANLGTILNLFNLDSEVKMLFMGVFTAVYSAALGAIRKARQTDENN